MAEKDIVERLRTRHENNDNPYAWQEAIEAYENERNEAADEIERLRLTILGLARIAKSVVSD